MFQSPDTKADKHIKIRVASCNHLLLKTVLIYAAQIFTYIYVEFDLQNKKHRCLVDHWITMSNRFLRQVRAPGAHGWVPHSLQIDKKPPGSKERKRGLDPSPLGFQSRAYFALFKILIFGFRSYF
jgi:hypothetical protein